MEHPLITSLDNIRKEMYYWITEQYSDSKQAITKLEDLAEKLHRLTDQYRDLQDQINTKVEEAWVNGMNQAHDNAIGAI